MPTSSPRSALLMVRLFVDEQGAAPWVARVSAFTHPNEDAAETGPLTRVEDVLEVVRSWIAEATGRE